MKEKKPKVQKVQNQNNYKNKGDNTKSINEISTSSMYYSQDSVSTANENIVQAYLKDLKNKHRSPVTIYNYHLFLKRFVANIAKPISEITADDVFEWFEKTCTGKKRATIILYYTCLKNFFKYCVEKNYISAIPLKKRWCPHKNKTLPKPLNKYDLAIVMGQSQFLSLRDRCIVLFLKSSGVRREELCSIHYRAAVIRLVIF
jgi:site-specific recombinase XerD